MISLTTKTKRKSERSANTCDQVGLSPNVFPVTPKRAFSSHPFQSYIQLRDIDAWSLQIILSLHLRYAFCEKAGISSTQPFNLQF